MYWFPSTAEWLDSCVGLLTDSTLVSTGIIDIVVSDSAGSHLLGDHGELRLLHFVLVLLGGELGVVHLLLVVVGLALLEGLLHHLGVLVLLLL